MTHAFPAVLEKLELHAFDMCKIIDSFVRYEPSTPRDLKRHLHSIEEKIIESLAWERGSSLYPLLVAACENQENQDKEADSIKGMPQHKLLMQTRWLSINVVIVLSVQKTVLHVLVFEQFAHIFVLNNSTPGCTSLKSLSVFYCLPA